MSRSRDVKIWAESSSIISMSLDRKSRIFRKNGDSEDLNDKDFSIMITVDDFRSSRCQKIVPVSSRSLFTDPRHFESDILKHEIIREKKKILSDTRIIIRDRIGICVIDITIHEYKKICEIMKWKKNRRDDRNPNSVYRTV